MRFSFNTNGRLVFYAATPLLQNSQQDKRKSTERLYSSRQLIYNPNTPHYLLSWRLWIAYINYSKTFVDQQVK